MPSLPGRPSRYRGKVDRPITFKFTPEGHAALAEGSRLAGLSRQDYVEKLLRQASARLRSKRPTDDQMLA